MRRQLNHAFSDKSLKDQEHLIDELVDVFIDEIGKRGSDPEGLDIVMWFNLLTFDIIGSLAFGQSFGGLISARYHEWIRLVTGAMSQGALADAFGRFPAISAVIQRLFPGMIDKIIQDTRKHEAHTMDLVGRKV